MRQRRLFLWALFFGIGPGACSSQGASGRTDAGSQDTSAQSPDAGLVDSGTIDPLQPFTQKIVPQLEDFTDNTQPVSEACPNVVAVAVSKKLRFVEGRGNLAPGPQSLLQIGSVTKVLTGLIAAELVRQNQLSPSSTPAQLLASDLASTAAPLPSLELILAHQAGLPNFPANLVDRNFDGRRDLERDPRAPAEDYSRLDLANYLGRARLLPSGSYRYSNLGFGILALSMQDQQGLSNYHELLEKYLISALELGSTYGNISVIPADKRDLIVAGTVLEQDRRGTGRLGQMGILAGSGEVVSSGEDLVRLLQALIGSAVPELQATVELALRPVAAGPEGRQMGYGIEIETQGSQLRYRKAGSTSSYSAYLLFSRAPQAGVMVVCGCGSFSPVRKLAESIYQELLEVL